MPEAPSGLSGTLYRPYFERDSCGFGLIANLDNTPSHWLVETAVQSLSRLAHRGAVATDGKTGDGCGLLFGMPVAFFRAVAQDAGIPLTPRFAVGQVFLHPNPEKAQWALEHLAEALTRGGLTLAGVRDVPINTAVCGQQALDTLPRIVQVFVNAGDIDEDAFERMLFVARCRTERACEATDPVFYVSSLSARIIIYKAMIMPANLPLFYPDLTDPRFATALCLYHQRFSTNTWPQWRLAQPFRYLAHNGEINTINGNRNWAASRHSLYRSTLLPELEELHPLITQTGSDSMALDNMLESLVMGGMDLRIAIRMLIPAAWQNLDGMDIDLRAFYEYFSLHMDAWDGPAGLVITDGRLALCAMDRNGLRPARYVITRDRHITIASEIGVYDYLPEDVVAKGKLAPGDMVSLDLKTGEFLNAHAINCYMKARHPYREWIQQHTRYLRTDPALETGDLIPVALQRVYEKLFLVTAEERNLVLKVLADAGQEAMISMGDDTALPVLSRHVRSLYDYFRQDFAQVTNPPIDPIRESAVMSLRTCFGAEKNPFDEIPENAARIDLYSPVISTSKVRQLLALNDPAYAHHRLHLSMSLTESLEAALDRVCDAAVSAVQAGKVILILSDRDIAPDQMPLHALMATGAVHARLSQEGVRCRANLLVETATARDPHQIAVLIGYGATAVYPYLAYQILAEMHAQGELTGRTPADVTEMYRKGLNKGLFKILSKMGISTMNSYRGARLFEAVGIHETVIERCFPGTVSRIGGTGFADFRQDQLALHREAWSHARPMRQGGLLKFMPDGEYHAFNPDVVKALQTAVRTGDAADYRLYANLVNQRPPTVLRDLLALRPTAYPISLDEVEPVEAFFPRFDTAAMSLGSLSPEAHEAMAIAMNRLGGYSNSGEGGEDPERYGTDRVSRIKQVASGRFGVTPSYLVNADVLQIKISQGAKPGEGGQLPGYKVNELIARLRCTLPGTPLISPPPHHDIYSIEDLAQLIFDLKQVNPRALISVKLVAQAGVGTVAAGVAKTYADLVTIAGYDGGTGASPVTSVKYTGIPWEMGLAETHQVLRANRVRHRIRLQADGGMKTGLDVVKAAILGAESFGFGTAPLIALGCKYLRICHLNNCATGIATQNEVLRLHHFQGSPEKVERYFRFVAEEVREWLAKLGARRLEEIIGQTQLLAQLPGETPRQQALDLSQLLAQPADVADEPHTCQVLRNEPFDRGALAEKMVSDLLPVIESRSGGIFAYLINNTHRSIGARVSGEIARRHGDNGMKDAPVTVHFRGTAGQSFGVWNAGGLNLILEGDANDYVGKGMSGGKIVVYPPAGSVFPTQETPILGNTCLYGATGGTLYAAGRAGERFAVRNSGATAVVEGISDHGCEYMTRGVVVVLGSTGLNFGAGMTGGFAYVLDLDGGFVDRVNHELVDFTRIHREDCEKAASHLRRLIEAHVDETGSAWGAHILREFAQLLGRFWLVKPKATGLEALMGFLNVAA